MSDNTPARTTLYPEDSVDNYPGEYGNEDDGTMPRNVETLAQQVIGHRIVKAEQSRVKRSEFRRVGDDWTDEIDYGSGLVLTLDDGRRVILQDTSDCCAYTEVQQFLLNPERVDHMITGVQTTEGYTKWHIFADLGDVLQLQVDWSPGNAFYYGYGFTIGVSDVIDGEIVDPRREIES
ncbi:hypothetical protein K3M35_05230 [Rhodococcus sp. DMU2021]|uniref:DUF7448 domain-containing protein n=1 Tax=Rhodococcus sp. DMU2021 TaxID=2866997 RepID=UPI001C7CA234|nr:hypothetical protein [Rhodococcus sp. DMU2021]MBX4168069.1 hypothetical protein [Rhodococcus sp. DMU2021]